MNQPLPKIEPYVTAKGGVVILNGPFPLKQARRIKTLCEVAPELLAELQNIADAKRFDRKHFGDDTAFSDWAQSRARAAIAKAEPDVAPI